MVQGNADDGDGPCNIQIVAAPAGQCFFLHSRVLGMEVYEEFMNESLRSLRR